MRVLFGHNKDQGGHFLAGHGVPRDAVVPGVNLITPSNNFNSIIWAANGLASRTQSGQGDPLGGTDAWTFTLDTNITQHKIDVRNLSDDPQTATDTFSVYAKQGSGRYVMLTVEWAANWAYVAFDLQTGTVTEAGTGGAGILTDYGAIPSSNGFYRIWLAGAVGAPASDAHLIHFLDTGTPGGVGYSFAGASETYYIFGAQYEADVSSPNGYTATT